MGYIPFIEYSDIDGETWKFYIPVEGNEEALDALREHIVDDDEASEFFEVADVEPLSEADVDDLVDGDGRGTQHRLEGVFDANDLLELGGGELREALHGGRIRDYVD